MPRRWFGEAARDGRDGCCSVKTWEETEDAGSEVVQKENKHNDNERNPGRRLEDGPWWTGSSRGQRNVAGWTDGSWATEGRPPGKQTSDDLVKDLLHLFGEKRRRN